MHRFVRPRKRRRRVLRRVALTARDTQEIGRERRTEKEEPGCGSSDEVSFEDDVMAEKRRQYRGAPPFQDLIAVTVARSEAELTDAVSAARSGRSLTRLLLWVALILLAVESLAASRSRGRAS